LTATNEKLQQGRALLLSDAARLEQGEKDLHNSMQQMMRTQDTLAALPQGDEAAPSVPYLCLTTLV
jgi:hypothetical protein